MDKRKNLRESSTSYNRVQNMLGLLIKPPPPTNNAEMLP